MPASESPLERIRAATRELHARIDRGAYAKAVLDGTLPISRYASFLRALYAVYGELEHAVETASTPSLREAFAGGVERRSRLARDLQYLLTDPRGVDAALLHALVLAQHIRRDAQRHPMSLFGHLYVLEGSQLGGLSLAPALTSRLELQHGGLTYLSAAGRNTASEFRAFLAKLEAALSDDTAVEEAVTGARHAFEGIEAILDVVATDHLAGHGASALNRDAGMHPVPSDVREVQAALLAGEHSRETWAYYDARYGERGLRFTRSDSAWLVTLSREMPERAAQQIAWLARVLAARGMPRLLLERHLQVLHRELIAAVPERTAGYETLQRVAAALANERRAVLVDERSEALARDFVRKAGAALETPVPPVEAGTLLVAAVIDEKCGIANAVESLGQWFDDPARFPQPFREAWSSSLQAARAALN